MNAYVIQILLIFISLVIIFNIFFSIKSSLLEKRISDYSLSKKDFDDTTTFEKINHILWSMIHLLSNIFTKDQRLLKLSSRYEKYILIKEEKYKSTIDYITIKFLLVIISILFYLFLVLANVFNFNILLLIVFIVLAILLPSIIWQLSYDKKCRNISDKLYESIIILDDNLPKTNIYNALNKITKELDEDIADEYQRVLIDLSYNISLNQAFRRFYNRTKIPEIRVIYHMLDIEQDRLEDVFHIIRKDFEYFDKKNTYKNSLMNIINILKLVFILLPIIMVLFISIVDINYFNNALSNVYGFITIELIVFIYLLFVYIIRKLVGVRK